MCWDYDYVLREKLFKTTWPCVKSICPIILMYILIFNGSIYYFYCCFCAAKMPNICFACVSPNVLFSPILQRYDDVCSAYMFCHADTWLPCAVTSNMSYPAVCVYVRVCVLNACAAGSRGERGQFGTPAWLHILILSLPISFFLFPCPLPSVYQCTPVALGGLIEMLSVCEQHLISSITKADPRFWRCFKIVMWFWCKSKRQWKLKYHSATIWPGTWNEFHFPQ